MPLYNDRRARQGLQQCYYKIAGWYGRGWRARRGSALHAVAGTGMALQQLHHIDTERMQ